MNVFVYVAAAVAGLLVGIVLWRIHGRPFAGTGDALPVTDGQMGYLFGGDRRVSQVWWAQLVAGQFIAPQERNPGQAKQWRRALSSPQDPSLFQAWSALPEKGVFDFSESHSFYWKNHQKKIKADLVEGGILVNASQLLSRQLQVLASLVLVFGLGMVAVGMGAAPLALACCVAGLVSLGSLSSQAEALNTRAGRNQMKRWEKQYASAVRAPLSTTVGKAVAIAGMSALFGTPFAAAAEEEAAMESGGGNPGGFIGGSSHGSSSSLSVSSSSVSISHDHAAVSHSDYTTTGAFGGESASSSACGSSSSSSSSSGCSSGGCGGGGGGCGS